MNNSSLLLKKEFNILPEDEIMNSFMITEKFYIRQYSFQIPTIESYCC